MNTIFIVLFIQNYQEKILKNSKKNYYDTSFNYDDFYNWVKSNSKNNKIFISENFMPNDFKVIWEKEYNRSLGARNNIVSIEKLYTI